MKAVKNYRSNCPVSISLDVLGDKWSLLIVRDLMYKKKCTYGDLLKSSAGIATNVLATKLQNLEEQGILVRTPHPENKVKILYSLTPKGIELLPMLIELSLWAEKHYQISEEWTLMLREIKKDKEGFLKATMDKIMSKVQE